MSRLPRTRSDRVLQVVRGMEDAAIGRVARRDKPFALGIISGIAIGYILFAKLRATSSTSTRR